MKSRPSAGIALASVGVVALLLSGCTAPEPTPSATAGEAPPKPASLTWSSFGGDFQNNQIESWQKPFTADTGIEFQNVSPYDLAQVKAMVQAGNVVWDIADPNRFDVATGCGTLWEEMDPTVIDPSLFVDGVDATCGAPSYLFGNIFSYDASAYPDKVPTSIKDFFNTDKFPGKRVIYDNAIQGQLEAALIADGVKPDDLYPLDIERALAKFDTIKDDLILAPTLGAVQQMLTDKQATMTLLVTARTESAVAAGVDLQPVWDFTAASYGILAIPKGSPNAYWAMQAMKTATQPENLIAYAELTGTGVAAAGVDPSDISYTDVQQTFNAFDAEVNEAGTVFLDNDYYGENANEVTAAWTTWKLG
jgi:putative spermidine/putrescine transport system substrate-binding protein